MTVPASGSIIRLMMRIVVVFPQPDGPISTQTSPSGTVSVSRSTAGCAAPGNRLVSAAISIMQRSPRGVIACCSAPNSRSVPRASSVAGIAPTKSCGSAIIAMPAVMKSPRPPPPMYAASTAPEMTCTAAVRMPAKITGSASGSSTLRRISLLRHSHAARRVDDLGLDLPHRGVGVDQDRRQREQRQREERRHESRPHQRHHERQHRERRQRAPDVGAGDRDLRGALRAREQDADGHGERDRDARAPKRTARRASPVRSRKRSGCARMNCQASTSSIEAASTPRAGAANARAAKARGPRRPPARTRSTRRPRSSARGRC